MNLEGCPDAAQLTMIRAMALLQEKWVLFIVRELMDGPRGFNELGRRGAVNSTTMAQRLDLLEREGVVTRTVHSAIPPKTSYALTEKGKALRPVLNAIRKWAEAYPPGEVATECGSEEAVLPAHRRK